MKPTDNLRDRAGRRVGDPPLYHTRWRPGETPDGAVDDTPTDVHRSWTEAVEEPAQNRRIRL